jgi:hypothetical protein
MLPGIDHELKMEMNPPIEYGSRFSRGMFRGKQGGNTSYTQPAAINGVRDKVFKDAYHVADVDGKLQLRPLQQEKLKEIVKLHVPSRQRTTRVAPPKLNKATTQQPPSPWTGASGLPLAPFPSPSSQPSSHHRQPVCLPPSMRRFSRRLPISR